MITYIQNNPDVFAPETVNVKRIYSTSPHINETHLDAVDVSKPVILAEIAPERYNLIDGHHRAEKANRLGMETIKAYRLKASQHIQFLTRQTSYEKYIEYWNDNVKELDGTERKLFLEDRCMDDFNPEHFDKDETNQQLKKWEAVWLNKWK
ncbi:MAG: ParB N-terminal domain-containing protein [Bacteroidales bacterium]|nr:ParB N-terminal domain-containing protein [Bacteroidales bacterium]